MGKETRDTRQDKAGGDDLEDGLDKASEQAAQLNDESLASLFIEANEEARLVDSPPFRDLFVEEKKVHHIEEADPDPEFLKQIYDSLARKEIHHKKLLEENTPTNRALRLLNAIRATIKIPYYREEDPIIPANWRAFSQMYKSWRRSTSAYLGNLSSLTDLYLRKKNYAQFMLKWEFGAMFLILIACLPIIIVFAKSFFAVNSNTNSFTNGWTSFILSSAVISCISAIAPLFFFMSLWFVNVNRLHTSKYFHIFLFVSFTVSFIFMCLAIFNTALFYWVDYKWGITNVYQAAPK